MKRGEAAKIEEALEEFDGARWLDSSAGSSGVWRDPKHIRFKPTIEIHHDGRPANAVNLRAELAAELRRIAAYLEA